MEISNEKILELSYNHFDENGYARKNNPHFSIIFAEGFKAGADYSKNNVDLHNVVGSKPTAFEKNNLPDEVKYAYCESIEMYQNIQAYEMGIIGKTDFVNNTIAIKDKYK